jgi:DNA-binding NtrC family response regulator
LNPTILILDDEEMIRSSLSDYFEDLGWSVLEAQSAEAAETILASRHVDFATVDLRLERTNGADFALAAKKKFPAMKILLFTGSFNYALSDEMIDAGFSQKNMLVKPIDSIGIIRDALLSIPC